MELKMDRESSEKNRAKESAEVSLIDEEMARQSRLRQAKMERESAAYIHGDGEIGNLAGVVGDVDVEDRFLKPGEALGIGGVRAGRSSFGFRKGSSEDGK